MRWFIRTIVAVFLGMSSAAMAEEKTDRNASDNIAAVHYICERNVEISAVYINTVNGNSYAVIYAEGKQIPMDQHVSASGARYVALDEQNSYRWYTKGDEAYLAFLEADHTAEEKIILSACKAIDD